MSTDVALFVCGVTSNRRGFEYAELGPAKLPGAPASYLDVYPSTETQHTYALQRLEIGGKRFIRYSRYRRINPNDSETNRGAYLAVGVLIGRAVPMHVGAKCIDIVSQVFGHLESFIGPDQAMSAEFDLPSYAYDAGQIDETTYGASSPLLLLDVLTQGLQGEGGLDWGQRAPIAFEPGRQPSELQSFMHYFSETGAAAQLGLDRQREELRRLTQKLVVAASQADQVQDEWLSFQSAMREQLPTLATQGTELRDLIEEVERVADAVGKIPRPIEPADIGPSARNRTGAGASYAYGKKQITYGPGRRTYSERTPAPARSRRAGLPELSGRQLAFGVGSLIAIAVVVAAAWVLMGGRADTSAGDGTPPAAAPVAASPARTGEAPPAAPTADGSEATRSDVAQERAALRESTQHAPPNDAPREETPH